MRRLLVVVTVYYLIFGYAQISAAALVFPGWRPGTLELLVLLVGPAAGWLVHQILRNALTRWVLRFVYLWIGLGFLLLWIVVPIQLLRLAGLSEQAATVLLVAVYLTLAFGSIVNALRIGVRRIGTIFAEARPAGADRSRSATFTWARAPAASFRGSCAGSTRSSPTWCS